MKISDHIKCSLDASDAGELEHSLLHVCLALDGTASKAYPNLAGQGRVGERIRRFINENLDIVELLYGGIDLHQTIFPLEIKGRKGISFADVIYNKYRCTLAHGNELPDGYGVNVQLREGVQRFSINVETNSMTLPQSVIYALGLICVLSPTNADQKIGSHNYYYTDPINKYVVDSWWGKVICAREIMDFESQTKVALVF